MVKTTMVLVLFAAAQEPAKPRPSLEETIRTLYKNMRSENAEDQLKALKGILPTRKDIEALFPKHVDTLWPPLEAEFKEMEARIGEVAKEFQKGGEITEIKLTDIRTKEDRYKDVLEIMAKDVPAYNYVIVKEKGTSGGGTYLYVNDRWIFLRGLGSVPRVLKKQK